MFLAGDAVHLVIPTGGLGMNSGVGDAIDLSWKLAATLAGWGGPNLLQILRDRAPPDRRPQCRRVALRHHRPAQMALACGGRTSREDTPAGAATRKNLGAVADVEQRKSNEMIGAELGYRYVDSPVICNIPGGPEHLFREYQPTTWPGARLPHVWLDDGTPMQDRIRRRLHRSSSSAAARPMRAGSNARIAPAARRSRCSRCRTGIARDIYGYDLILVRPDMHVVWRGNAAPEDAAACRGYRDGAVVVIF